MKYKNIFFDWDGTAVYSRTAPAQEACEKMRKLLDRGINLIIISGTTYENIAGGELHTVLKNADLSGLYLGLGRGALNYGFENGEPVLLSNLTPTSEEKLRIDEVAFEVHKILKTEYALETDIVFSRPNYCKVDIMVGHDRGDKLFLTGSEIEKVNALLREHHFEKGLPGLITLCNEAGKQKGLHVVTTTDAKYLEIGLTTKSNNVNYIVERLKKQGAYSTDNSCFWGDEFASLADGVQGSDSFMLTELTRGARFFDVSEDGTGLPEQVEHIGGGVPRFLQFLEEQYSEG